MPGGAIVGIPTADSLWSVIKDMMWLANKLFMPGYGALQT